MKIAFDAGHGKDNNNGIPGVISEHEFNASVVKYCVELAKFNEFEVVLTQPLYDIGIPLIERTNIAIRNKVDALVSIHADWNTDENVRGYWNFYWHNNKNSKILANIWIKYAKQMLSTINKGSMTSEPGKWTDFHMVRVPATNYLHRFPAILCECGFMSNKQDLELLLTDSYRRLCAEVTVIALCEFFGKEYRKPMFKDVPKNHYSREAIERVVRNEIMVGVKEKEIFGFGQPLKREDFAVVIDTILQKLSWYKK